MKKVLLSCCLSLLFTPQIAHAKWDMDSVKQVWLDESRHDTIRLSALLDIAWNGYLFVQPDSGYIYAQKMYDYATEKGLSQYQAQALNVQGISFDIRAEFDSAIHYFSTALEINLANEDKQGIAASYGNLGTVNAKRGNLDEALRYYLMSLEIKEEMGDQKAISNSLNNIGNIYRQQGNYPMAIEFFNKSLKIDEEIGRVQGLASTYGNISSIYGYQKDFENALKYNALSLENYKKADDMRGMAMSYNDRGASFAEMNNFDEALNAFNKAKEIHGEMSNDRGVANSLKHIGQLYLDNGKEDEALDFLRESLVIYTEIKDELGIAAAETRLAEAYNKKKNYSEAISRGTRALQLSEKNGVLKGIRDASSALYKAYKGRNNDARALEYYERYIESRDSLVNDKNVKEVIRQEFEYAYEKQAAIDSIQTAEQLKLKDAELIALDATIKSVRFEKYILWGGIGFLLLVGLLTFIYFRSKQKAALELTKKDNVIEKQKTLQHKLKALSAQMNPHFIFNSLNSVQYYIHQNDVDSSKMFLSKFAGLMRKTLDNSEHAYISLEEEVETLKEYIELERLRMNNKFVYEINVQDGLNTFDVNIPTLIIQPYVENAIWHGISPLESDGKITIHISEESNRIRCVIDDNGVGRIKSQNDQKTHKSYAMSITKTRLDLINSLEDEMINIDIIDKTDESGAPTGTRVELFIPNDLA